MSNARAGVGNNNQPDTASRVKQAGTYLKYAIFTMNETDLRAWQLVCDVPKLKNVWAYVACVLNIFLPGTGTMLAAVMGDANINKTQLTVGVFQFLTAVSLLGLIWSWYWAYLIVTESSGDHSEIRRLLGGR